MVRAHFGQSNFPFFQQKRKKEILLILIIFTYFKVQKKREKKKMVRKIDHRFSCVHVTSFPLISLTNRFFLCWEHSVPGMKTVELTPHPHPPSHFPLPIFTPSRRFHPQSTTNNSNLQGNREKLINFKSKWNYVRISKTKAPPPTSPPTLCKSSNPAKISQSKVDTN